MNSLFQVCKKCNLLSVLSHDITTYLHLYVLYTRLWTLWSASVCHTVSLDLNYIVFILKSDYTVPTVLMSITSFQKSFALKKCISNSSHLMKLTISSLSLCKNSSTTTEIFKKLQTPRIKKYQISRKANQSWKVNRHLRSKNLLIHSVHTLCVLQVVEEVCAWKFYFWLVRCLSNCIPECLKFIPCDAKPWRHIRNSRLTE